MKAKHLLFLPLFLAACQSGTSPDQAADSSAKSPVSALPGKDSAETVKVDTFKNIPDSKLIIPGRQIGRTKIDESDSELFSVMKKPDAGDAAMGKAWNTWYSKPAPGDTDTTTHQTNVFTSRQMGTDGDTAKVKIIRVTSPFFATKTRVSANRPLKYLQQVFPGLKRVASFSSPKGEMQVFDDEKNGIAFEVAGSDAAAICRAVIVHEAGKPLPEQYAGLHAGLKRL